jgi:serine/threonine-protein kinase PpkA
MSNRVFFLAALLLLSLWLPGQVMAESPLLQEEKTTLYQRVVTHPGAVMLSQADASATVVQATVKPFSVFYVYGRENGFAKVGPASNQAAGWIRQEQISDWPQAMTLLFTERSGRLPVFFFKDLRSLIDLCQASDLGQRLQKILQALQQPGRELPESLPVLAHEPLDAQGAVAKNRFYLMPIQDMKEPFSGAKFLQVASIDPGNKDQTGGNQAGAAADNRMRTGIAFVIDTTISMRPYIEQSLGVIRRAFDSIEQDKLGDTVGFAIVAFRNNLTARSGLEYSTKVVSDFVTVSSRKQLEDALAAVREASASSHSFNEDSFAGVKAAVDNLSWQKYQSRIMVLISDAGPLPATDQYSSIKMGPMEMLDYAKTQSIWITVLHIRTPAGAANHSYAESAYRALSRLSDNSSSYISLPAPTEKTGAESFAKAAETLANSLTRVVKATAANEMLPKPAKPDSPPDNNSPEDEARRIGDNIGYAMQLEFLGQQRQNPSPHVVSAWIADMDLSRLAEGVSLPCVEVAVLLSKNQLSDLQRQLKIIIDEAERVKRTDAKDFFQSILSTSASITRDPARFSQAPGQNLRQMGVMGEFLEGLPYQSDVMLLTEDDWYRMSVGQQTAFINRLRSRIARYEEYDKDTSNWEGFGSPNPGDWVYRVPLSMLP